MIERIGVKIMSDPTRGIIIVRTPKDSHIVHYIIPTKGITQFVSVEIDKDKTPEEQLIILGADIVLSLADIETKKTIVDLLVNQIYENAQS